MNEYTIVDTLITGIVEACKYMLHIEMPMINADISNTKQLGTVARYYPEDDLIAFNYKWYIKSFEELADLHLSNQNLQGTDNYYTESTVVLAMLIFHEARHRYQHLNMTDVWQKAFEREQELNINENSSDEDKAEYANLATEIDARAFSIIAVAIFFRKKELLNVVDNPFDATDMGKYNEVFENLKNEFSKELDF